MRRLVVVAVLSSLATITINELIEPTLHQRVLDQCEVVVIPEEAEGTSAYSDRIALLQHAGWYGDPTDGRDALYSPGCAVTMSMRP